MDMPKKSFDFIIVGGLSLFRCVIHLQYSHNSQGGTSGCVLASRLAEAPSHPSVLLIEAGSSNSSPSLRTPESRWTTCLTEPELNWNNITTPQPQLHDRILPCFRGKGLGGSSAINFSNWIVGSEYDFDYLAERVGDDAWKWDGEGGVKEKLRRVERLYVREEVVSDGSHEYKFLDRDSLGRHSTKGKVGMTFGDPAVPMWAEMLFEAAREAGVS